MPSTTQERFDRWPGMDAEACSFLESEGFELDYSDWCWSKSGNPELTERQLDAMLYLIEEWDYGGYVIDKSKKES